MPKFRVLVTREATESTTVEVTAKNAKKAEEKALEVVGRYGENVDTWEVDDGNQHEVYICDEGNCAEEVDPNEQPYRRQRPPLPPVPKGHQTNLDTINRASQLGDLALMQFYAHGERDAVTVLCAMQQNRDGTITPVPLARMFPGNPFEILEAPFDGDGEKAKEDAGDPQR